MTNLLPIHRVPDRVRRPAGVLVPLLLIIALGALVAACSGDETEATDTTGTTESADTTDTAETTDMAGETTTGITEPEADESSETVQTLDDAAPADAGPPVEDETALLAPGLALDPNGLDILDPDATTTELLAFGDDQGGVIAGLEAVLGTADQIGEGTAECPNGQATVATWEDTIMVDFNADEQFLSWLLLPGSELTTKDNVGIGSPVSALGDVTFLEDSTLGDEFEADGFGGLASGPDADATIERLWAGEVCSFR